MKIKRILLAAFLVVPGSMAVLLLLCLNKQCRKQLNDVIDLHGMTSRGKNLVLCAKNFALSRLR